VKYDSAGNQLWVQRYNGPGNYSDGACAIAIDGSGNIYVTGHSGGSTEQYDYATVKYDPDGNQLWVQRYNGPGNSYDWAQAIALDGFGNDYVTGTSNGKWAETYEDYATVKYDSSGNQLWVQRYNGPGNYTDGACAITIDGSGNVYVTGTSAGEMSTIDDDYATIKYDSQGNQLWVQRYNGPLNYNDGAYAIALDGFGNVYVTGYSCGSGTYEDYATVKYDSSGNQLWVQRYNGPGNYSDEARAIETDGSGNVYVTGTSYGNGAHYDYATVKYDSAGNQLWVQRPGNYSDEARAIDTDGSGNVYVTGWGYGSGTERDYSTIKYIQFLRGDVNADKKLNVSDVVYLINYLFKGGPTPNPLQSGDANCDGQVTVSDVVYLINYLFKGGPSPC
jgi:hypothetical protein